MKKIIYVISAIPALGSIQFGWKRKNKFPDWKNLLNDSGNEFN
ncbi:hypothetical protein ACIQZD_00655 [Peribacillus sp. NPDC096447]